MNGDESIRRVGTTGVCARRWARWSTAVGAGLVALSFGARSAAAQDPTPTPPDTSSSTPAGDSSTTPSDQTPPESQTTRDAAASSTSRLFFLLPNFLTVKNSDRVPPMDAREKYAVVTRSTFDYVEFPWYAFTAGVSQADDSDPTFGLGWKGYGKRYATAFTNGTIENYFVGAITPSLLHQDPRYYQLGSGGFLHRAGYAISRIAVTRSDSGQAEINASEIVGSAISAGLSNLYEPREDRTLTNTLSVWRTMVGYDTLTMFLREFWPDIRKLF